jgi:hypothetical protein
LGKTWKGLERLGKAWKGLERLGKAWKGLVVHGMMSTQDVVVGWQEVRYTLLIIAAHSKLRKQRVNFFQI